MRRNTWTVLTAALIFFLAIPAYSDTCNHPFPNNVTYPFGIKPNNYTNAQMNAHVQAWFNKWQAKYVTQNNCTGAEWRLQRTETGNGITNGCYGFGTNPVENDTVSEGIGYGMVILAYMSSATNNTKAQFDGMYLYFKNHLDGGGLMNWQIPYCSSGNSATDADEDVAFALLVAEWQWGDATGTNYGNEANTIIGRVLGSEITAANDIKPGDSWDGANPSYFAPYEYKMFATKTGTPRWNLVASHSYQTFVNFFYNSSKTNNAALGIKTGLQPNWCQYDGTPNTPGAWAMNAESWWWDAIRHAWRQAYDYVLYGTTSHQLAHDNSARLSYFFKTKYAGDASLIKSQYSLDGTEITYCRGDRTPDLCTEDVRNLPGPEGAVAIAAMAEGDQTWLNECYYTLVTMNAGTGSGELTDTGVKWGTDYFCDILKMQYLLILTGNEPNPMGNPPTPTPTNTVTFGPSPTFTPVPAQGMFDDFETGAIVNLDTSGGGQTAFTSVTNATDRPQAGLRSLKIVSTANGWGAYGQDSPYTGGLGYRNYTGATALDFYIYSTAAITFFTKLVEATANGADGETFATRASTNSAPANAWTHITIPIANFKRDDPNSVVGNNVFNLSGIKSFYLQIDGAPNATIWIDNITFTGTFATATPTYTVTRTKTPNGTSTITETLTATQTNSPYFSPTITPTMTITMSATPFISATVTMTSSITPTWTASPYIPLDIFDDFETGVLKNPSTANTGGGAGLTITNTAASVHAGVRSMQAVTTGANGYAVGSIDSPYDGGLGYRDFTGATGISFWVNMPAATNFFIKIVETNGQQWSNRGANSFTTGAAGWQQLSLALSVFTIDQYSPNVPGDTTLDLYRIQSVVFQWDNPGGKTMYIDDIRFTGMPLPSATFTQTRTRTGTPTGTSTRTSTVSPTPSRTVTGTQTFTPTRTGTFTQTPQNPTNTFTGTNTFTCTRTPTASGTPTASLTVTPTMTCACTSTFTNTRTATQTLSATATYTVTSTPSASSTATKTPTPSSTRTWTASASPTVTPTNTVTPTMSPSWTGTPPTWTVTPTITETLTQTSTSTVTATPTGTGTATKSSTPTFTATGTPTYTGTATATNTLTLTCTYTSTPTMTNTFTQTYTATPTYSATSTPTATHTPTRTITMTCTISPTYSVSPTFTATVTGTPPTQTVTPTITMTGTPSATPSATRTGTPTATQSATPTGTSSNVPTSTVSPTWTVTGTLAQSPSMTATPTPNPSSPTPTATVFMTEHFEIRDPLVGPNPYNGTGTLQVLFEPTRPCSAVTLKIYTDGFRLVRKADLGSCGAGPQSMTVAEGNLGSLANGTYYYIIIGESDKGLGRAKAEKLLIIK